MSPAVEISAEQLQANRANAALSTGPRTPEGKARARNNAWSHGLTGRTACMPYEDRQLFEAFCDRRIAILQPEGESESQLARDIAEDHWRIHRVREIEGNVFAIGQSEDHGRVENALNQAQGFLDHAHAFGLLSLYESRLARKIARNEAALKVQQSERRAAYERALAEAELLAQAALANGEIYDPRLDFSGANGFVFSTDDLLRRIDRKRRLREAHAAVMNLQTRPAHLTM